MNSKNFIAGGIFVAVLLFGGLFIGMMFVERIPSGYVGVVYSTDGVEEETLGTGWHVIGMFDKVIKYPTRMQTVKYKDIQVATTDGKNIEMDIAYNFTVDPVEVVNLFNKFGAVTVEDITEGYLRTRLWDASRKAVSKYNIIEIYGQSSSKAASEIQVAFADDVGTLGFLVDNLTMGVPKPDESTQKAIDERVKATQELERKQTELEIAKAEAERLLVEAEGKANANRILTESLSDKVLNQQIIDKWDGVLPLVTDGNSMIQLPMGRVK